MKPPEIVSFSLIGGREVNEDTVLVSRQTGRIIGIVADGLGGHGGGDAASQAAAAALMDTLRQADHMDGKVLRQGLNRANAAVLALQAEKQGQMMSTVAVAVLEGRRLWTAHLGDTRIYRFSGNRLRSCTHDDSVTQLMADKGEITREEMRRHETRNLLIRCLGRMEPPDGQSEKHFWWSSSRLLICSDGFWEHFSDAELASAMACSSARTILDRLKKAVTERMTEDGDNCSAVLICEGE